MHHSCFTMHQFLLDLCVFVALIYHSLRNMCKLITHIIYYAYCAKLQNHFLGPRKQIINTCEIHLLKPSTPLNQYNLAHILLCMRRLGHLKRRLVGNAYFRREQGYDSEVSHSITKLLHLRSHRKFAFHVLSIRRSP